MRTPSRFLPHLQKSRVTHTALAFPVLLITAGIVGACASPQASPASPPPPPPPPPAEHVPPPVEEEEEAKEPTVKIIADVGFSTPESVYFDKKRDVYLVSNINGGPIAKDGNGFISKVTPDGEVTLKFIDGADKGIDLNAPKGLTISGDTLYVADIDHVRLFDAQTGLAKGAVKIEGATFLNGLSTGKDGVVYVSDSGLDANFASTGTDAIYSIVDEKLKTILRDKSLGSPNGLAAAKGGVWVTTFGSGELFWVSDKGKKEQIQKLPQGKNDGLITTKDDRFLVSSWEDSAVFARGKDGSFHKEISGVEAPADIGYDCQRNRVLIPLFKKNAIVLHTLAEPAPTSDPK